MRETAEVVHEFAAAAAMRGDRRSEIDGRETCVHGRLLHLTFGLTPFASCDEWCARSCGVVGMMRTAQLLGSTFACPATLGKWGGKGYPT